MPSEDMPVLLSIEEVTKIVHFSQMHIWRLRRDGAFPQPVKLGANRIAWVESEIRDWIKARMEERAG